MLSRLVYASRAPDRADLDIPLIIDWSRKANVELDITGVLCLLDGVYMQYLEGEEDTVNSLFDRIRVDSRHHDVTPLDRRPVPRRAFPDWSMALLEWTDNAKAIFRSFSPGTHLDLYASDPSTAAPLVRALIRAPDWKLV